MALLDVGCGPGTITADLASLVAPGVVVGVDVADDVVSAAARDHVAPNLSFRTADVTTLGSGDGIFDVVHAHQVLQHLQDPVGAVRAMARVARPGGIVAARDSDYGAFGWWPADPRLDDWNRIYHEITDRTGTTADAGRRLPHWFRSAGLTEITVTSSVWVFHAPEDRAWWGGTWADRVQRSAYARHATGFGLADEAQLATIADAFREWADRDDGCFVVPHVEVLARVP